VLTSNVDGMFERNGFDPAGIATPQGVCCVCMRCSLPPPPLRALAGVWHQVRGVVGRPVGGGVERHTVLSRVCSLPLPPCACVPVCLCACLPPARWVRHHAVLPPPLSPGRYLALQASAGHTEGCYRRGWCQEPEDRGPLLPTAHVPLLWRGRLPQYVVMPSLSCAVAIMRSRYHAQSLSCAVAIMRSRCCVLAPARPVV
jgi:hypothetical protein